MNKFILCAMDKSKTVEELKKNSDAAAEAAAEAAADAAADAAAAEAAAAYAADVAYWLKMYFKRTGEDREEYEKELNK